MIIQDRNGDGISFIHRAHEGFALFISINLHRAAAFGENINFLLISVVVRGIGTLVRLKDSIAGHKLFGRFAYVKHEKNIFPFQMADPLLIFRGVSPGCMADRVLLFRGGPAHNHFALPIPL